MDLQEGGDLLQDLYLKRFYSDNRPKGTLEKVISFQKKLQDFKITKNSLPKSVVIDSNNFLQQQFNRFRPTTNHTSYRVKREKYSASQESKRAEGPATSELRLILDKRHTGEISFPETKAEHSLYSAHNHRKKMKLLSHRDISRQQSSEPQQKISKIDMGSFLTDRNISTSEKNVRPVLYNRKANVSIKQNDQELQDKNKIISKKVFIGGRDLEKAAEEYYKHYKEINKNIEKQEAARREKKALMPIGEKKSVDRKKVERKGYKKQKLIIPHQALQGPSSKTQPKNLNYDDLIINLELNPWNVDVDYY